jgi:hypothetical protein
MKLAVEMDSGDMMYIPVFVNIGSGIQMLIEARHTDTDNKVIS